MDDGSVLRVARWSEVFETAESRRHRQLVWIAQPVKLNSSGYLALVTRFKGLQRAAVYGAWCALLKAAAIAPRRGVLASSEGVPYTPEILELITHMPVEAFELLIPWAENVGWLERVSKAEAVGVTDSSQSPVVAQAKTGLPDITGPDLTRPNKTPDRSGAGVRSGPGSGEKVNADFLPDWLELNEWRGIPIEVTREECSEWQQDVFERANGDALARCFRMGDWLKAPHLAAEWHAVQCVPGEFSKPAVGTTLAHQALVLAAVLHVAKIPEATVTKSRSGMLMGILKGRDNPARWDHVRNRLVEVAGLLSRHPIRDAIARRSQAPPKTTAADPTTDNVAAELAALAERHGPTLDSMGRDALLDLVETASDKQRPTLIRSIHNGHVKAVRTALLRLLAQRAAS